MAASPLAHCLLFLSCLLSPVLLSDAAAVAAAKPPHALVLPVKKDPSTLQYVTRVNLRTPPALLYFVVDLGNRFLWLDCDAKRPPSSSLHPVLCNAPQCSLIKTPFACVDNTSSCSVILDNPYNVSTVGDLFRDAARFLSTDGSSSGPLVTSSDFLFTCAPGFVATGLARGASGIAGFGRNRIGLPIQLAVDFKLQPKFALCLTSSPSSDGVIFVGEGPYRFLPNVDASQSLMYTPLLVNPVSTAGTNYIGEKSVEYFIGVKSIKVNGKVVPLNTTLLSIDRHGNGGTKISTVTPYTLLETSIYKAVTGAFATSLSKLTRVAPVGKFKVCYDAKDIGSTRVGAAVPSIDLVMQNESVSWIMFGANTMVEAKPGALCLAFVDGGVDPTTSIVIGGYQMEDNLIQIDLKNSRLGFTSSLLFRQTTCANFNFTAKA